MFLPLLTASRHDNGRGIIGDIVQVFTNDDYVFLYRISEVDPPHARPEEGLLHDHGEALAPDIGGAEEFVSEAPGHRGLRERNQCDAGSRTSASSSAGLPLTGQA
jgi:hypothetical protein